MMSNNTDEISADEVQVALQPCHPKWCVYLPSGRGNTNARHPIRNEGVDSVTVAHLHFILLTLPILRCGERPDGGSVS